jgi:hypothetical protein
MTTLTDLLNRTGKRLLRRFVKADAPDPTALLKELDDEHVRTMAYVAAGLFKAIKVEAERRGIWDDIKTAKVTA